MRSTEYEAYLASPTWQEKRAEALERAQKRCQLCNNPKRLDVHHRTYERFGGEELPEDLTVLCRSCHDTFHAKRQVNKPKKRKRNKAKPRLVSLPPEPKLSRTQKDRARARVAEAIERMEPGGIYTTTAIAEMAEVPVSRAGGFLGGFARRRQGVEQLGNKRWRRRQVQAA